MTDLQKKFSPSQSYKLLFGLLAFLINCATSYNQVIGNVEQSIYKGDYESAVSQLRDLANDSENKDRLLFLMEAGVVLHNKGDYFGSNKAFGQAEEISDEIRKSIRAEAKAFLLSDNESNFIGEDFEHVMIKFYMALNYLCLGDYEAAKRYFRKVEYEQKEMRVVESKYKQNITARYLDAIVSEYLGNYNDARVNYKNILELEPSNPLFLADRYLLALKEGDVADQNKFISGKNYLQIWNKQLKPIPYNPKIGELIIINQAGKAAIKESRGKLGDDPTIARPLFDAVEAALRSDSQVGMSLGAVLTTLSMAEHPIPIYKPRDGTSDIGISIFINGKEMGQTIKMTDYSAMAMNAFNENYNSILAKNLSSLVTKVVIATTTAYATGELAKRSRRNSNDSAASLIGGIVSFLSGLAAGAAVSATVAPDLRSWHTIPSNFQVRRILLEQGEYEVEIFENNKQTKKIVRIEEGKPTFLSVRNF